MPAHHAQKLGELVANLQSLEFVLRAYLYETRSEPHVALPYGVSLNAIETGHQLPVNAFTDYSNLTQLIQRYNGAVATPDLAIDLTLRDLRDALAHGRISSDEPAADHTLMKFSKPSDGKVIVEYKQEMSAAWFDRERKRVANAVLRVHTALDQLGRSG